MGASFQRHGGSGGTLIPSPLFLLLSDGPFRVGVSRLLLYASLLSTPIYATRNPARVRARAPTSSDHLPTPLTRGVTSKSFSNLRARLHSALLGTKRRAGSRPGLLRGGRCHRLLSVRRLLHIAKPSGIGTIFSGDTRSTTFVGAFLRSPT